MYVNWLWIRLRFLRLNKDFIEDPFYLLLMPAEVEKWKYWGDQLTYTRWKLNI